MGFVLTVIIIFIITGYKELFSYYVRSGLCECDRNLYFALALFVNECCFRHNCLVILNRLAPSRL